MVRTLLATSLLVLPGCFEELVDLDTDGAGTSSTGPGGSGPTDPTVASASSSSGDVLSTSTSGPGSTGSGSTTFGDDSSSGTGSTSEGDSSSGSSTGGVPSVCPVLFDTFDDGAENALWIQTNPASTFEEGGQSIINITPAPDDEFARMMVAPGPFTGATMRVEVGTPPADDGVLLILWIEQQDGEGRIAFNLAQHGTDLRLEARITSEAGPPGAIFDETDWNPATQPWLQLREDSGTTYFEASQDGVAFDTVFQIPNPIGLDDVRVGFVGHNNVELAEAVQVSVETFELICG